MSWQNRHIRCLIFGRVSRAQILTQQSSPAPAAGAFNSLSLPNTPSQYVNLTVRIPSRVSAQYLLSLPEFALRGILEIFYVVASSKAPWTNISHHVDASWFIKSHTLKSGTNQDVDEGVTVGSYPEIQLSFQAEISEPFPTPHIRPSRRRDLAPQMLLQVKLGLPPRKAPMKSNLG